ncbi:MAG: GNAT family N-acetyltransferase [Chloroflexi bacterium]|nr:GNAT family N-acetyltransferase [Chloroflexota bacterium]MDA1002763.1 GNAT family N-acetyltransferase [Chloroflexota bacterium]
MTSNRPSPAPTHPDAVITTPRLELRTMSADFLEATLFGDLARAEAIGGFTLSEDWPGESPRLLRHWIDALRADPTREFWMARAIVQRSDELMVGHIGCHDRPGAPHMEHWAPGANAVEIGYTVFAAQRGLGYATEAAAGLMDWAWVSHGVDRFIASVSPDNAPSLRVITKLGFVRIGSQIDDVDGPEDVYERRVAS